MKASIASFLVVNQAEISEPACTREFTQGKR